MSESTMNKELLDDSLDRILFSITVLFGPSGMIEFTLMLLSDNLLIIIEYRYLSDGLSSVKIVIVRSLGKNARLRTC